MNVLFYRYNSICEPMYIDGLKRMGIDVIEENSEMSRKSISPNDVITNVQKILDNNKILFVMSINYFPVLSAICNIYNIIYVSVIVDCPVWELYSDTIKNKCNRVFIFDKVQYSRHIMDNEEGIFYTPLCADFDRMQNVIVDNKKYESDVSFIGSLYTEKCPYNNFEKDYPPYMKGYFDGIIESQLKIYGYNMIYDMLDEDIVNKFMEITKAYQIFPEGSRKDNKALLSEHFLGVKVSEQERIRLLRAVSEKFDTHIYTGSDTSSIPKIVNKGLAKSLTEMPLIFNQSKINLQITARTIQSGLSQRVWDVLACGGFLITNYQEEISEYFDIGVDLEVYTSEDDLISKIKYYLEHEDERKQIARNGFEKVRSFHTIDIRLKQMVEKIFREA